MRHGLGDALRLAGWTAGLVVAARLLHAAGSDSLSVPLTSLDDLAGWVSDTPPADMAMALLRLAALAATWYLLAVTSLAVVARLVRVRRLRVAVDHISPSVVRRLVTGGSGIGLALGAVVGSLPAPDLASGREPATIASAAPAAPMFRAPEVTATMTRVPGPVAPPTTATGATSAEATMTRLGDPPPPATTMTRIGPAASGPPAPGSPPAVSATPVGYGADTASPATAAGPPAVPEIDPTSWVVEPGDSLWSIASEVTSPPGGPAADQRVVGRYWRRLVEANRAQLVDPDNADLLVPGQRLVVPPPDG